MPTQGMIRLFSPQIGIILEKYVNEGQTVTKGEALLVISSERATMTTGETQAAMLAQLRQRRGQSAAGTEQNNRKSIHSRVTVSQVASMG